MVLLSNAYGAKPHETTAQLALLRFGFDGNHFGWKSILATNEGHFGCENGLVTDERGNLVADLLFGNNHVMFLTNLSQYGNLKHGVVVNADAGEAGACRRSKHYVTSTYRYSYGCVASTCMFLV